MTTATTVSVDAAKCLITVTHRIHFHNLGLDADPYSVAVERAKRIIREKWSKPEFRYQLCTVKFVFQFVDEPSFDADIKNLCTERGADYQQSDSPARRQAGVWFPESWGASCTPAHETGHELGMSDKYRAFDRNGNAVDAWIGQGASAQPNPAALPANGGRTDPTPGYSRNGIAFSVNRDATVQQEDIDEIMQKLGVTCPCDLPPVHEAPARPSPTGEAVPAPTPETQLNRAIEDGESGPDADWTQTFDDPTIYEPAQPDRPDDPSNGHYSLIDARADVVPLFFVPGIMGSALVATSTAGGRERIWPIRMKHLTLDPLYPDVNRKTAVGLYPGVYDALIEFITRSKHRGGLGRTLNDDFFVYPYDWTRSNRDTGHEFQMAIAKTLESGNARRARQGLPARTQVDVICHSMGGFVTRMAIKLGAPVRRTVYIGTPHYGAPKAYFMLHPETESSLGLSFFENLLASMAWKALSKDRERNDLDQELCDLATNLQSVWELLPDIYYLGSLGVVRVRYGDRVVEQRGVRDTYLKGPWRFATGVARLGDAMDFKEALGPTPPEERMLIRQGVLKTPLYVVYDRATRAFGPPKARRAGDETVPAYSAESGTGAIAVPGNHMQIPNDLATHTHIRQFIPTGAH